MPLLSPYHFCFNKKRILFRMLLIVILIISQGLFSACTTDSEVSTSKGAPSFLEASKKDVKPLVILISIDGFKPEYLERNVSPTLKQLVSKGALAQGLISTFPSLTFPNHYSIVTGLYADHHGIVNNTMKDPSISQIFKLSSREAIANPDWWSDAKPIWVSAIEQGKIASTLFWPGTEAKIRGIQPNDWLNYDHNMSSPARVDQLLIWLSKPNNIRADFATLYFSEVDSAGHAKGPNSESVNQAIKNVDESIGRLLGGLKQLGLEEKTSLVIVSDHGMSEVPKNNWIEIGTILKNFTNADLEWSGPVGGINVENNDRIALINQLNTLPHLQCFDKAHLPTHLHFGTHRRIPKIICLAENHYVVTDKKPLITYPGHHGYDPNIPDMHGLFIASGYRIKKAGPETLKTFENIEIYPLLARLLMIQPEKNDAKEQLFQLLTQ